MALAVVTATPAVAQSMTTIPRERITNGSAVARELFLEVVINDISTGVLAAFRATPEGSLTIAPEDLATAGLKPLETARGADGRVILDRLPGVSYRVDEPTQQLHVTTADSGRVTRVVDARGPAKEIIAPRTDYGALLNYSLFGASGSLSDRDFGRLDTLSGSFDARVFGPLGIFSHSFIAGRSGDWMDDVVRLRTAWSYSDPINMITYRAGDIVSGGLSWTRPVYLGGAQVQRNFHLRPDLVTKPLPSFSGSAAVPSSLEIYTHNVRTWSSNIAPGPFEVVNVPVIGQNGEARIVLRDSQGRETLTSLPFFSSDKLLQEGFFYFSAEAGFPRHGYGVRSDDYDDNAFAILSARYGFSNRLTLEGHFEAGPDLVNGGAGVVFLLGRYGTVSLAGAGSAHDGEVGALANAALELRWRGWALYGRTQRTFGEFNDVASVSAQTTWDRHFGAPIATSVPRAIDQVTLSVPMPFERAHLQLAYMRLDHDVWDSSEILSINYSQQLWPRTTFRASMFQNLTGEKGLGLFAGISIALDDGVSASVGYDHRADGARVVADAMKSERPEPGSVGWRVRVLEGDDPVRSAAASYRAPFARFETTVTQYRDDVRATASAEGALAFAGGGVFASPRIHDAFAVVNVGAPDVEVSYQNRPVGRTDRWGRLLVPNLHSYETNAISIDPSNLPVDAQIPSTREIVVPMEGAGVVVGFGVSEQNHAALVAFVDANGAAIKAGTSGRIENAATDFLIGYGGEAFLQNLTEHNVATITFANGKTCRATFIYRPDPGVQVKIGGVACL